MTRRTGVPCGKFVARISEYSAFLARRDDEGLAGLVREGATPPGALRTGELGSELAARDTSWGYSLLELVISLPIAVLVLILVAQLLQDVQRTYSTTRDEVVDPFPHHTLQLLRNDLQGAIQIVPPTSTLPGRPLDLVLSNSSRVRYEKSAGEFLRSQLDASGQPSNTIHLLKRVMTWTWSESQPGLVDIQVDYLRREISPLRKSGLTDFKISVTVVEPLRLRVALRGIAGKESW